MYSAAPVAAVNVILKGIFPSSKLSVTLLIVMVCGIFQPPVVVFVPVTAALVEVVKTKVLSVICAPPPLGKTTPSVVSEDTILDIVTVPVGSVANTTWSVMVEVPSSAKLKLEIDCKRISGVPLSILVTLILGVGVSATLE